MADHAAHESRRRALIRMAAREAAARDRIAVPPDLLARIDEAGR